jgi:hypothetical protein
MDGIIGWIISLISGAIGGNIARPNRARRS